jgi:hypothetical protein
MPNADYYANWLIALKTARLDASRGVEFTLKTAP